MEGEATMTVHPEIHHLDREERIRLIAYAIWEEEGRPDGRDTEHWMRACELVDSEAATPDDPAWLQRTPESDADSPPPTAEAEQAPLDELVKRMRRSRAA
jgi:hypothetical protein